MKFDFIKNIQKKLAFMTSSCFFYRKFRRNTPKIHTTYNFSMMKTLLKSACALLAIIGIAHATPASQYVTQNTTVSADTNGQDFTFTQFNTSLGTLTAVDLIINSSVPGGNFTLTRSNSGSGTASFTGFTEFLQISDNFDIIFDGSGSPISITVTGNSSIARPSTNLYLVNASQSLLSSAPYTASIAAGAWSLYQGSGSVTLNAGITADAAYTANKNITPSYTNLFANSSLTLRYTYTPTTPPPSSVPEPGQVASSLLVLGGLAGYVFMKRRQRPMTA